MGSKIEELNISDNLPEWADEDVPAAEIMQMLKTCIKNQKADLALLELYVNKFEDRLNRLTV